MRCVKCRRSTVIQLGFCACNNNAAKNPRTCSGMGGKVRSFDELGIESSSNGGKKTN